MNETAIAWTDHTWNLFSGCKKISPECAHCYADTLAERHRGNAAFPHGFDLTVRPHKLAEPAKLLKSKGPSLIFCESMSDIGLDDDELEPGELDRLHALNIRGMDHVRETFFDTIEATPEHRYQVLTKRPEVIHRWLVANGRRIPSCVWFGVTIGSRHSVGRLGYLHMIRRGFFEPGAVAFVSAEPLLDDLSLALDKACMRGVDWLIVGGESGQHASDPKHTGRFLVYQTARMVGSVRAGSRWVPADDAKISVRRLLDLTREVGAAFFFKQWGGPTPTSAGRLLDGRTWDEMPTVPGALPARRSDLGGAATAALARKRLPLVAP